MIDNKKLLHHCCILQVGYIFIIILSVNANISNLEECENNMEWNESIIDICWLLFKEKYGIHFKNKWLEPWRKNIWTHNLKKIIKHNAERRRGLHTYQAGFNIHGHRTDLEIRRYYLNNMETPKKRARRGYLEETNEDRSVSVPPIHEVQLKRLLKQNENVAIPSKWDWREMAAAACNGRARDQAPCGSCYIFAAIGMLECQWGRRYNTSVELSVQRILDCGHISKFQMNDCHGGFPTNVLFYLRKGAVSESCYPYRAKKMQCSKTACPNVASTKNANINYTQNTVFEIPVSYIRNAIFKVGPVTSTFYVNYRTFRWYKSGIYGEVNCSQYISNHAVTTFGYGPDYWIAKNSFGSTWGLNGYFQISSDPKINCNFHESIGTLEFP